METSDYDWRERGIAWILFSFDHIGVFVLSVPPSDVPVQLLNQPNIRDLKADLHGTTLSHTTSL